MFDSRYYRRRDSDSVDGPHDPFSSRVGRCKLSGTHRIAALRLLPPRVPRPRPLKLSKDVIMSPQKYRLITRSDFDGLVCAVLLNEMNLIDEIKFVHPKDMQDGKIDVSDRDITTNLPYMPGVHLAFDHHLSETLRNTGERSNYIIDAAAPSAARVVYNHYGGKAAFPRVAAPMMLAVDKADSAQASRDDTTHPG